MTNPQIESDFEKWVETLVVLDPQGNQTPLILNEAQRAIFRKLIDLSRDGNPPRLAISSARGLGMSTIVTALERYYET